MPATLESRLPAIAAELRPRVSKGVKEGAEHLEGAVEDRIPIDTGQLAGTVRVARRGPAEYAVRVGDSEAFYGCFLEYGTVNMPPQPFLLPAADEEQDQVTDTVRLSLHRL